jgi:hypothetical protein
LGLCLFLFQLMHNDGTAFAHNYFPLEGPVLFRRSPLPRNCAFRCICLRFKIPSELALPRRNSEKRAPSAVLVHASNYKSIFYFIRHEHVHLYRAQPKRMFLSLSRQCGGRSERIQEGPFRSEKGVKRSVKRRASPTFSTKASLS